MDPSLALAPLSPTPPALDAHAAILSGAFTPVILPTPWLPPAVHARWALAHADLPLAERVAAALDAGMVDEAWAALAHDPRPPSATPALDLALSRWAAAESARLGLPGGAVAVVGVDRDGKPFERTTLIGATQDALGALSDVADLFDPIGWPRWSGAVVVVSGAGAVPPLVAGQDLLARPALPAVRIARDAAIRVACAGALCRLALRRCAPPAGGWPAWLEDGLVGVAEAKARGEGPSPIRMFAVRQRAGAEAIDRLLRGRSTDQALATAVCAPLAHSKRRDRLPNLLDALRNGIEPEAALKLAYDATPERLATEK